MSSANKDKGREFLSAMFSADAARLSAVMPEDFKMWMPQSARQAANMPIPLEGRENAVATLTGFGGSVFKRSTVKWDEMTALAENDRVAIQFRLRGETVTGLDYDNTYVFLFRIAGGKVAEVWESTDTAYAQSVFFAKGPA
jgi:ketosteroid isomerase-like protein